jgi:hypothetical protein
MVFAKKPDPRDIEQVLAWQIEIQAAASQSRHANHGSRCLLTYCPSKRAASKNFQKKWHAK